GADPTQAANQDRITSRVWLIRGGSEGLYNIAQEGSFSQFFSPTDTEWASGSIANYASLTYADWETWAKSVGGPPATPGVNAVLHLKTDDIYLAIKFRSWGQRSGGFSYERSTPGVIPVTTTATPTTTTTVTTVSSTTSTTLAGGSLGIVAGWNLVGNGSGGSLAVATVFGDAAKFTTVWKWIAAGAKWAFYAPSLVGQALVDYATSRGYDVLTTINAGEGFWVNATSPFTAPLPAGTAITSTSFQTMASGWNLIAIGDNKTPSQFNALASTVTPFTTMWAWDAAQLNWYFYAPSLDGAGTLSTYISSKGYLNFGTKVLDPATGFWVNKP
ncbi:MAG: hypothetical protein D4R74_10000, partial [Betaproteobacteria bacterium]